MDTGGLVLAAKVHGADLPDRDGGRRLLEEGQELARMELLWADGAYTGGFREWLRRRLGRRMEVPRHRDRQLWRYGLEEKPRGFLVLPRRWVVEIVRTQMTETDVFALGGRGDHVAYPCAADRRLPWERPQQRRRLTPCRVLRGFAALLATVGTPADAPKPCGRSPGRPKGRLSGRAKRYPALKKNA